MDILGFCHSLLVLEALDSWIRRKLRRVMLKQWTRGRSRFSELSKRGVNDALAAFTAGRPPGPWQLSQSPALCVALPMRTLPGSVSFDWRLVDT